MPKGSTVIAIDGPAGVGKSTVGAMAAAKLGYRFVTTGEMYRALAWRALGLGIAPSDEAAIAALAGRVKWDFYSVDGVVKAKIDGLDAGNQIFSEEASKTSSLIARHEAVRSLMTQKQRELGMQGPIIMEGRDIGTVVFPDAELKIFLDATPEERAKRRYSQLNRAGGQADFNEILEGIKQRDKNDSERKIAPLKRAEGSEVIDTSNITVREVVERILALAQRYGCRHA